MILSIADYLDWPSFLSFLTTNESISSIFTTDNIHRLNRLFKARLLASESAVREQLKIAYAPTLEKAPWNNQDDPYSEPGYWLLPCYTCQQWQPKRQFSSARSVGPYAIGQRLASQRICLECGLWTGFYPRGCRMTSGLGVCEGCGACMDVCKGRRFDLSQKIWGTIPQSYPRHERKVEHESSTSMQTEAFQLWWGRHRRAIIEAGTDIESILEQGRREPFTDMAQPTDESGGQERKSSSSWFKYAHEGQVELGEGDHPALQLLRGYWWTGSRRCLVCVRNEDPKEIIHGVERGWKEKIVRRYATGMAKGIRRRRDKGRLIRKERGIPDQYVESESGDASHGVALRDSPTSFPKYIPTWPHGFVFQPAV
ncbi:MAG: hypothetical protein Q9227_004521 [Pyrenula ochraceoflavens]